MKNSEHPIFQSNDPWFKRIMTGNAVPRQITAKFEALKRTGAISFSKLVFIDDFLHYVPLHKDKVHLATKEQMFQLVQLIKTGMNAKQFKVMNGGWFEKLLGAKGIHKDDMTPEASQLIYEALMHGYMMLLLEHEYTSNNIGKAHYSVRYLVYRCGYYCCSRYWSSYTVYYYSNTMLKLKGTFQQVKSRRVAHTELAQYYTYLFGFHTKLFVQTAKAINEYVFGDLPQLDKSAVIDAAKIMEVVVTELTKDIAITRTNIAKIETLIGTNTFTLADIDEALVKLDASVQVGLNKSKAAITKQVNANMANLDGKTGSITDLIQAQIKNQTTSFATMGLWMFEAFNDVRNKQVEVNGIRRCSACSVVETGKAAATIGGTFGFGLMIGYITKKAKKVIAKKRSTKDLELAQSRIADYDKEVVDEEVVTIENI